MRNGPKTSPGGSDSVAIWYRGRQTAEAIDTGYFYGMLTDSAWMRLNVMIGMFFSNLILYFIILSSPGITIPDAPLMIEPRSPAPATAF